MPGTVHDPSQPLVLGNQASNDYVVLTWDNVAHRLTIQSVYLPPGGSLQQSTLTFRYDGQLLINGASIAQLPEIAAAVSAAQAAATAAQGHATNAQTSATNAQSSASTAASSSNAAETSALNAQASASAPEGTTAPGGGDSAAVSAVKAGRIAEESRELDVSDIITVDETFQSGFLYTERQCNPAGLMTITIPPGIFSSPNKRRAWASYKLRNGAGSVKFVGQAGGTNLVTPTLVTRARTMKRYAAAGIATRRTLTVPVTVPSTIVAGELVFIFHALHNGPAEATTVNFSNTGPSLTWNLIRALPANATAVAIPDWYIQRAILPANFPAQSFNLVFDEGTNVHFQACDWFLLDGVEGSLPFFDYDERTTVQVQAAATLPALPAQSLVLGVAGQGAPATGSLASAPAGTSANMTRLAFGQTAGIDEAAVADDNRFKNEAHVIMSGVSTVAGDFLVTQNWTLTNSLYRGSIAVLGYKPKSVIGGGTVVMNYEGDRDTLTTKFGVAELWFHNDGTTVDVRTPKP